MIPDERAAWLVERRSGIGASDAAAVCGLSKFADPLSVYLDKLGLLPPRDSEPMRWGLLLEEVVAAAYLEEHPGHTLSSPGLVRHPEHPWMFATLDRVRDDGRIVQLKTARSSKGFGVPGTDQVPEMYLIQEMHEMACAVADVADVAVLIGNADFRTYTIPRNEALIARLVIREARFWHLVETRTPPEPDWERDETPKLIELLHRPQAGTEIDFTAPAYQPTGDQEQCAILVQRYEYWSAEKNKAEKLQAQFKARVVERMGAAALARLEDGRTVTRKEIVRKAHSVKESRYYGFYISQGANDDVEADDD